MLEEGRTGVLSMVLRPMSLYRKNVWSPPPPPSERGINTPVLLIIPTRDPFVSEFGFDNLDEYATHQVTRREWTHHTGHSGRSRRRSSNSYGTFWRARRGEGNPLKTPDERLGSDPAAGAPLCETTKRRLSVRVLAGC